MASDVCPRCHLSPCGTPEKCRMEHDRLVETLCDLLGLGEVRDG